MAEVAATPFLLTLGRTEGRWAELAEEGFSYRGPHEPFVVPPDLDGEVTRVIGPDLTARMEWSLYARGKPPLRDGGGPGAR